MTRKSTDDLNPGRAPDPHRDLAHRAFLVMLTLLLRLNNRFPKTVNAILALGNGSAYDAAIIKLYDLATPLLNVISRHRPPD